MTPVRWLPLVFAMAACGSDDSTTPDNSSGGAAGSGAGAGAGGVGAQSGNGGSDGGGSGGSSGAGGNALVVDATSLSHKLMFGYQGWFLCPGDGSPPDRWVHWFKNQTPSAANLAIDLWPDPSELDPDELFPTNMTYAGGQPASLYSAFSQKTVARHFQWMKDAGIDGVMLQRFLSELSDPAFLGFRNQVASNVRAGAEAHGRTFSITYDISGANEATLVDDLKKDWTELVTNLGITSSDRYLRHKGKPLLGIWGLGFSDRPGSAAQAAEIIAWFTAGAPAAEQVTLMGGVPTNWRTLGSDSKTDPAWTSVYESFDVISPWSVGRFADTAGADDFLSNYIVPDLAATSAKGIDYLPSVFPGFSWQNLNAGPLNQIPRNGGAFWWHQVHGALGAGSVMLFGAMFDEVDEGTAMFKLAATAAAMPEQGSFVALDIDGQSLPSDWYLRLAGEGSRMLRGEIPLTAAIPITP